MVAPIIGEAQESIYGPVPPIEPPYYRIRYEASSEPMGLAYPVRFTVWIPKYVKTLRGVIVHQHGCGEGSCKSGLTGAFDLHWQALANKHGCALLAPSYEQPEGHPELADVPWALWGHSGGGQWAGSMTMMHPNRVVAAWLRSGVAPLKANPDRPTTKPFSLPEAALTVPIMCNLGTKEGVTDKQGRFSKVWPMNESFFQNVRQRGGLIGIAIDPVTAHECGNQRYVVG